MIPRSKEQVSAAPGCGGGAQTLTTENRNNSALDSQTRSGPGGHVVRARPHHIRDKDTGCEGAAGATWSVRVLSREDFCNCDNVCMLVE